MANPSSEVIDTIKSTFGSGSTVNMFISGGLEEAPTVGSRSWYTGSLSFFVKGESFWGLTCDYG